MLSASGSENSPIPLQNDDIQTICTCLHRTDNEKGALRKGSFVRIKALAYELGFATPETFSATFKRSIGMLPTKFRKEMRRMYNDAQETN